MELLPIIIPLAVHFFLNGFSFPSSRSDTRVSASFPQRGASNRQVTSEAFVVKKVIEFRAVRESPYTERLKSMLQVA